MTNANNNYTSVAVVNEETKEELQEDEHDNDESAIQPIIDDGNTKETENTQRNNNLLLTTNNNITSKQPHESTISNGDNIRNGDDDTNYIVDAASRMMNGRNNNNITNDNNDDDNNNNDSNNDNNVQHSDNAQNNDNDTSSDHIINYKELRYGMESFHAIIKPVFLTMVLTALSVIYVRTESNARAQEESLSNSYNVIDGSDDDTNAKKLGTSLINGIVIVSFICALTFVIVLLYKFRCMKILIGYMVISSALLLGFLASNMFRVAIERYELYIDKISFGIFMYNFAAVGVIAIFAPVPGITPIYIQQAYLVATSVIVAWQLSFFDPWTAWVLLVLLAFYDLFAVLTPCGPLKALIKLMQRDNAPPMPGLLYEASLPAAQRRNTTRNTMYVTNNESNQNRTSSASSHHTHSEAQEPTGVTTTSNNDNDNNEHEEGIEMALSSTHRSNNSTTNSPETAVCQQIETPEQSLSSNNAATGIGINDNQNIPKPTITDDIPIEVDPSQVGHVPFALAKYYKLRLRYGPQPFWVTDSEPCEFTPEELCKIVEVIFPSGGGRIVPSIETDAAPLYINRDEPTRYTIYNYQGVERRVLFVNEEGRLFQCFRKQYHAQQAEKERTDIKLGLGDFIFYSILVSKAALYSFTTFAVCTLVILSGLGMTLLLLAVYGKALPALPISIFLGVIFYLYTRYVTEPWIHDVFIQQVYA